MSDYGIELGIWAGVFVIVKNIAERCAMSIVITSTKRAGP